MAEFTMADVLAGLTDPYGFAPPPARPAEPSPADLYLAKQARPISGDPFYGMGGWPTAIAGRIGEKFAKSVADASRFVTGAEADKYEVKPEVPGMLTEGDVQNQRAVEQHIFEQTKNLAELLTMLGGAPTKGLGSGPGVVPSFTERMAAGKDLAARRANAPAYTTARAPTVKEEFTPLLRPDETKEDVMRAIIGDPAAKFAEPSIAEKGRDSYREAMKHLDDLSSGFTLGSGSKKSAPALAAVKVAEGNESLQYLLGGKSEVAQIGREIGDISPNGISVLRVEGPPSGYEAYRLVNSENGKITGAMQVTKTPNGSYEVANTFVDPSVRRQGVATALNDKATQLFGPLGRSDWMPSEAGLAFRQSLNKPTTEMTPIGEQYVLPGAEQRPKGEILQRLADEKLKPSVAQKPADEGLFAPPDTQGSFDLGSGSKKASPAIAALKAAQEPTGPIVGVGGRYRSPPVVPTVDKPQRIAAPGIYGNPRDIAAEALGWVAPEHEALKAIFNVNRRDLYDIAMSRKGNIDPYTLLPGWKPGARGSEAAERIMNPRNAQRLIDTLAEARKIPELTEGMAGWYVMDPAYQRLEQLVGPEQAKVLYTRKNTIGSMASPGSDVETELLRGTAANYMAKRGRFDEFLRQGGGKEADPWSEIPYQLRSVPGHVFHSTSQAPRMSDYLNAGMPQMQSPKVPLYIGASGVPQTGFQTGLPVADTHIAGSSGLWDVRGGKGFRSSMLMPEFQGFGPWYAENVARPLGMEPVSTQGLQWGTFAPHTDVRSLIGAPKLELLAKNAWEWAKLHGVDPKWFMDQVLLGEMHLRQRF